MTSRRQVLKAAAGLAGLVALPSALAACDASMSTTAPTQTGPEQGTSANPAATSASEAAPRVTLAAVAPVDFVTDGFTAETGIEVVVNTVSNFDIADASDAYFGGAPEDVLMWVTGYRMREAAAKGYLEPLDDVWASIGSRFSPALKEASTGDDGRIYAIPWVHGPWAVFYRKSLFTSNGYAIPTTWTEYLALAERMKADGITPLAFGDQEQFPSLGLFDIVNLRQNGFQFHTDLIAGRQRWIDPRVHDTFARLRELLATAQPDPAGRSWSAAATALADRQAGMMYFGYFVTVALPGDVLPDLGMFAFPALETAFDAENAVEDPSDAFVLPRNAPTRAADADRIEAFLEYIAAPEVQARLATASGGPGALPAAEADEPNRTPLQEDGARIAAAAGHVTQFLDRDTNVTFTARFQELLHGFVITPDQPIDPLLASIQAKWEANK